jgi:hypothetical protein
MSPLSAYRVSGIAKSAIGASDIRSLLLRRPIRINHGLKPRRCGARSVPGHLTIGRLLPVDPDEQTFSLAVDTAQIANTINDVLEPRGVGVIIKASHHCMTTRGVHKPETDLVTSRMLGCFRDNALTRREFLGMAT